MNKDWLLVASAVLLLLAQVFFIWGSFTLFKDLREKHIAGGPQIYYISIMEPGRPPTACPVFVFRKY